MIIQQLPVYTGEIPALGQEQSQFNTNVSDKLAYDAQLVPAQNTYATEANALAAQVQSDASDAESSAAAAASNSNFKGEWPGDPLSPGYPVSNIPASYRHNGRNWQQLQNIADITLNEPQENAFWTELSNVVVTDIINPNLISNSGFEIAGSVVNPPDATPRTYNADDELFAGHFAVGALTGVTYVGEELNGVGQLYVDILKSQKQQASTSPVTPSIAGANGLPKSGATVIDNGTSWRVTYDMNDTFSVKLEQGNVATVHETQTAKGDIYEFDNVNDMVARGAPIGAKCSTGHTKWIVNGTAPVSNSKSYIALGNGLGAFPLNSIGVTDYGATGDGENGIDDTVAIQAAADSIGPELHLHFPRPKSYYAISDSIYFGKWVIDANNNPIGVSGAKVGLTITGEAGGSVSGSGYNVKWIGPNQTGLIRTDITDSVGTYSYITDDKSMFELNACRGVNISGMSLDGDNKAYSGFLFDQNHQQVTMSNFDVDNVKIPVRISKGVDLETSTVYYGHGDSPYYKANVFDPASFGGFQADTYDISGFTMKNVEFGLSVESAQALAIVAGSGQINGKSGNAGITAAIHNSGGRLTLNGINTSGDFYADILNLLNTSEITATSFHTESTASFGYVSTTANTDDLSLTVKGGDFKGVLMQNGAGAINLSALRLDGDISRGSDSSSSLNARITLNDVTRTDAGTGPLVSLGAVSTPDRVQIQASNLGLNLGTFVSSWESFVGEVSSLFPEQKYTRYEAGVDSSTWTKRKTGMTVQGDGYETTFSGASQSSIPASSTTPVCRFKIPVNTSFSITMQVTVQSGGTSNFGVVSKTITFGAMRGSGNYTLMDGLVESLQNEGKSGSTTAVSTSFTLGGNGVDEIEINLNQTNLPSSQNAHITYSGSVKGGYPGGVSGVDVITPLI